MEPVGAQKGLEQLLEFLAMRLLSYYRYVIGVRFINESMMVGIFLGPKGSIIYKNRVFLCYAVAKDLQYWKCARPNFSGCAI